MTSKKKASVVVQRRVNWWLQAVRLNPALALNFDVFKANNNTPPQGRGLRGGSGTPSGWGGPTHPPYWCRHLNKADTLRILKKRGKCRELGPHKTCFAPVNPCPTAQRESGKVRHKIKTSQDPHREATVPIREPACGLVPRHRRHDVLPVHIKLGPRCLPPLPQNSTNS